MSANRETAVPPWWFLALLPVLAFALVFAAFAPALAGHFLAWDDAQGIAQNEHLRLAGWDGVAWRFTTTHMGHYQPLSWWSLSLDVAGAPPGELGDAEAACCHRTNLLLHAFAAVALGILAERLLRLAVRGWSAPPSPHSIALAALFAGLAWAVHPLRAESVAWITERRDVLSAGPLFLSIYMYVLWAEGRGLPGAERQGAPARTFFLVASLFLLLVSLLSKAWGIAAPAVLLVLDFHPLRRGPWAWKSLAALALEKAPYFALSIAFAVSASWAQSSLADAMPGLEAHSLSERALQAAYGLGFYLAKSVAPTGLLPLYELPAEITIGEPRFLAPLFLIAVLAFVLFRARRRLPGLAAAALAFAILVAPVLGFAQAGPQLAADRYTYLAGAAFALALAGGLLAWSRKVRWLAVPLGAAVLALSVPATRAQSAIWRDNETLWSHVVAREPGHVVGNLSLGNELARRAVASDSPEQALDLMRRAEQLFAHGLEASSDARFASKLALVHRSLAELEPARADEHRRRALEYSERAVALAIATGRVSPEARLEHALRLLSAGRVDEALAELEWYAAQRPDDPRGRAALDEARAKQSQRDQ